MHKSSLRISNLSNFMLVRTAWSSVMYFLVSFDGHIVTISMDRSTCFYLGISATFGLLQYQYQEQHTVSEVVALPINILDN